MRCSVPDDTQNTLMVQLNYMTSLLARGQAIERRNMYIPCIEGEAGLGEILILRCIPWLGVLDVPLGDIIFWPGWHLD